MDLNSLADGTFQSAVAKLCDSIVHGPFHLSGLVKTQNKGLVERVVGVVSIGVQSTEREFASHASRICRAMTSAIVFAVERQW